MVRFVLLTSLALVSGKTLVDTGEGSTRGSEKQELIVDSIGDSAAPLLRKEVDDGSPTSRAGWWAVRGGWGAPAATPASTPAAAASSGQDEAGGVAAPAKRGGRGEDEAAFAQLREENDRLRAEAAALRAEMGRQAEQAAWPSGAGGMAELAAWPSAPEKDPLDSEPMAEDVEDDGEGSFADDNVARAALLEQAWAEEAAARETLLKSLQGSLDASLGSNGQAVIGRLDAAQLACPEKTYLHETFVHADMQMATFVCKPCHAACASRCSGSGEAECWSALEPQMVGARSISSSEFAKSFLFQYTAQGASLLAAGEDIDNATDKIHENMTQCIQDGSCSVSDGNVSESVSANLSTVEVEVVWSTSVVGNVTDPLLLKGVVQRKLNEALGKNGFIPGMYTAPELEQALYNFTVADEDGSPDTELGSGQGILQNGSGILQNGSLLEELESSLELTSHARMNRTRWWTTWWWNQVKSQVAGLAKDWVKVETKKAANDYAKKVIVSTLRAKKGDCVDAVDQFLGASQHIYGCFKSNYQQLRGAYCAPPEQHESLTKATNSMLTKANVISNVATPMQHLPWVGPTAKTMVSISGQVKTLLDTKVEKLKSMKERPLHWSWVGADPGCCWPYPKSGCNVLPGEAYRCASCSKGGMCTAHRGCNTLVKLEEKVDQWKAEYYDPLLQKLSEATMWVQGVDDKANLHSWLAKCDVDFSKCSKVKALSDKLVNEVNSTFLEKHCPLKVPSIPFPDLTGFLQVEKWWSMIFDVFKAIDLELGKLHCLNVPDVKMSWERRCARVCTPCCSYHGRRRWSGSVSCGSCCHNVCSHVLITRITNKRHCFSVMNILKGVADFLGLLMSPFKNIIEAVIDALLKPIRHLIDRILSMLDVNLDFNFPSLPNFEFRLPALPSPSCAALKAYVGNTR